MGPNQVNSKLLAGLLASSFVSPSERCRRVRKTVKPEVSTTMKPFRLTCLGVAVLLALLARADRSFSKSGLGTVEGTLDYCKQVDAPAAAKYEERKKILVRDVPEEEVAEARASEEYKRAYEKIDAELGKVPKDKMVEGCAAYLKGE
jgi:hypothetical protein